MRHFYAAGFHSIGAGEGSLFVAKEFAFQSVPGIAGQFTFTHGPVRHGEAVWIMRAIMSLPVPLSP